MDKFLRLQEEVPQQVAIQEKAPSEAVEDNMDIQKDVALRSLLIQQNSLWTNILELRKK